MKRWALPPAALAASVCVPAFGQLTCDSAELQPAPLGANAEFGNAVALGSDVLVIGAWQDQGGAGTVYVFRRSAGWWDLEQQLGDADLVGLDLFGTAVGTADEWIAVGTPGKGRVTLFRYNGRDWANDQWVTWPGVDDQFGEALAVSGDVLVVGASEFDHDNGVPHGAAMVYRLLEATWEPQAQLNPPDTEQIDRFGAAVDVHGDTIVVGAPGADDAGLDVGAAYVFVRSGGEYQLQQTLTPSPPFQQSGFGSAVTVRGDVIVVGTPHESVGAAYVFRPTGPSGPWVQESRLEPFALVASEFGTAVDYDGQTIIVGASQDGAQTGTAYLFHRPADEWVPLTKLSASDAVSGDQLARKGVAVSGTTAAAGAAGHLRHGGNVSVGSVYVFDLDGPDCTPVFGDLTGDGLVDTHDFLVLLAAWGPCPGGCPADLSGDGDVDSVDFLVLLANWN